LVSGRRVIMKGGGTVLPCGRRALLQTLIEKGALFRGRSLAVEKEKEGGGLRLGMGGG